MSIITDPTLPTVLQNWNATPLFIVNNNSLTVLVHSNDVRARSSRTFYIYVKGTSLYSQGTDDAFFLNRLLKNKNSDVCCWKHEFPLLCAASWCLQYNRHKSQSVKHSKLHTIRCTYMISLPSVSIFLFSTEWLLSRTYRIDNVFYIQCWITVSRVYHCRIDKLPLMPSNFFLPTPCKILDEYIHF